MRKIGNDIVDLTLPEAFQKWRDRRFLERVFSPGEQELIYQAASRARGGWDRDRCLWSLWAAKESAYKALYKAVGPIAFSHQRFRAFPRSFGVSARFTEGKLRYGGATILLRWEHAPSFVHCVAVYAGLTPLLGEEMAWEGVRTRTAENLHTGQARRIAQELLAETPRGAPVRIERAWNPRTLTLDPPLAWEGSEPCKEDLSLSHDGGYCAAAIIAQIPRGSPALGTDAAAFAGNTKTSPRAWDKMPHTSITPSRE